jgi:hypothetical protein
MCDILVQDEKEKNADAATTIVMKLLFNSGQAGAIIGKGGSIIRDVQAETGVRMTVSNEALPGSTEKTVTITGTPPQVHGAALRCVTQLKENPVKAGVNTIPYIPGSDALGGLAPPLPFPGAGFPPQDPLGLYGFGPPPPPAGAGLAMQKIAIPTVCAGSIIGHGGSIIADLKAQSGCNISLSDPGPESPNERVVTLVGSPPGIQTGVNMIRQIVENFRPGAPPGAVPLRALPPAPHLFSRPPPPPLYPYLGRGGGY